MNKTRILLRRQLADDIISFKFGLCLTIILVTTAIFSLLFIGNWRSEEATYSYFAEKNERALEKFCENPSYGAGDLSLKLIMRSRIAGNISMGDEERIPHGFIFRFLPYELRLLDEEGGGADKGQPPNSMAGENINAILFSPDLTFLVQFILSFFALMISFDSITAEKEYGTLRMVFSNSVKRVHLVIVKYLSAYFTMLIPLCIGIVLSNAIMLPLVGNSDRSSWFFEHFFFVIASGIYLSLFILIGILASICGGDSAKSLVICLLFWIGLVIIAPRIPGLFTNSRPFKMPSTEQIEKSLEIAGNDILRRYNQELPLIEKGTDAAARLKERVVGSIVELRQKTYDYYLKKKIGAIVSLKSISLYSPAMLFELTCNSIAATGISRFQEFNSQAELFAKGFIYSVQAASHLPRPASPFGLDPAVLSAKPINKGELARFVEKAIQPGARLWEAVPYIAILLLYNLIIAMLIYAKFLHYDLR